MLKSLSHYRILCRLGSGGMGEVYEAEDTKLGRRVALKVLPQGLATRPEALERFKREARALAALNHPNIVTIYSVEEADGHYFLTMERVEGRPLSELIPESGVPLNRLFEYAIPLADALAFAHQKGISHRDLKPANVMVNDHGVVKVIDFGLAKLLEPVGGVVDSEAPTQLQMTVEGQILGTPYYMSPEQIEGRPVDHRTDIFSLGVLLCEMATGQRPFKGVNAVSIMSSILRDHAPPLTELKPELPEHLGRIVRHCLQKDPSERYQSALDVRNELKGLQEETKSLRRTPESKTVAVTPPLGRPQWRRYGFAVGAAALVIVVVLTFTKLADRLPHQENNLKNGAALRRSAGGPLLMHLQPSRQVTYEQGLEDWPSWAPDGERFVYSGEVEGFKNLFIRSLKTGEVTRLTQTNRDEVMPAWNPANADEIVFVRHQNPGGKLELSDVYGGYFSSGGDLWKLNLKTGEESLVVPDGYNPSFATNGILTFHRADQGDAGIRIWTSDGNGHYLKIQTRDDSTAIFHLEPSMKPDGSLVIFRREEKNRSSLWVANLKSGEQFALTKPGLFIQPCWSPSGNYVYFSSYLGRSGMNLWRIAVGPDGKAAGEPEPVTSGQGADMHPALSPDGRRLMFSIMSANSDIWKLPVDKVTGLSNGPPEAVIVTSREDSRGAWSPDEKWIAFNSDRDGGNMNLWLHPMTGESDVQITRGPGGDYQPNWSPDGKSLAFFSLRSGNADIWLVNVENGKATGAPRQLTTDKQMDMNPFFSPDGRYICFMSDRLGSTGLFVMDADGSNQRSLDQKAGGHFLGWYGNSVAVEKYDNGEYAMARLSLEGKLEVLRNFGTGMHVGGHVSFSPDRSAFMELNNHLTIWVFPLKDGEPQPVFRFLGANEHIDYPVWSPSGRWVLFDRMISQGSDIYLVDGLE